MTVDCYLNRWLNARSGALALTTVASYRDVIVRYINPAIGEKKLNKLKKKHICALIDEVYAQHPRTAQLIYAVLHKALDDAGRKKLMEGIDQPTYAKRPIRYWTPDQARAYLQATRDDRYHLAWLLALTCGLRRGEIIGLRWEDVDEHNINIRNQRVRVGGQPYDTTPKTRSSIRAIPIVPAMAEALERQRRLQLHDAAWYAQDYVSSPYVITKPSGGPISANGLTEQHAGAVARAGLPYVTLHGLRHTMATTGIQEGAPLRAIQTLLGHNNYATTEKVYTHIGDAIARSAIASITQAMS